MPTNYQQSDTTFSSDCVSGAPTWMISAGAAAGTVSHSATVFSAGGGATLINFRTPVGDPGTASWLGAVTVRFEVTTANANVTWYGLVFREGCSVAGTSTTAATSTSGLGISFGTTGVKTASVEITASYTLLKCTAATANVCTVMQMSSAATMSGLLNYKTSQLTTLPFSASAAPAPSSIFTLAQMNVGH